MEIGTLKWEIILHYLDGPSVFTMVRTRGSWNRGEGSVVLETETTVMHFEREEGAMG